MAGIEPAVYARMQQSLHLFCQGYSVIYRNYLSDERFTLNDFRDADHLNQNGAVKFSDLLYREVLLAK